MNRGHLVRVALALVLGTAAYVVPFGAVAAVLLPARIAEIDPLHKVPLLAGLGVGTALAGLTGNLVFGALSDRTLARWHGRLPWMVGGAVGGALLMMPLTLTAAPGGVVTLMIWWFLAVGALNATTVSVFALLPDHVPRARRATLAGIAGVGNLLGNALGTTTGAVLLRTPSVGVASVAGLTVVLALGAALAMLGVPALAGAPTAGAVATAPAGSADEAGRRPDGGSVPHRPRAVADFYRAFIARLLLVLSYFMIHAYQLYVFTDYVGLDVGAAARAVALTSALFLATALVGAVVTGIASDRRRRRKPAAIACAVLFLAATTVPLAVPSFAGMIVFSLVGGFAVGSFYAVDVALMSEVLPRAESRGRDLGILNVATTTGQVLGPASSSALLGLGFGYAGVFVGAVVACALGVPFLATIRTVR